jgi:D-alanine-D-alanine ligase-like ATP-grasp enzyme
LKVIIINRPKEGRIQEDSQRFQEMLTTIRRGGVDGRYYAIQTKSELLNILQSEHPDLIYCANYYIQDENGGMSSIHRLLDELQVSYIGSAPDKLELVLSKIDLKEKWQRDNVPTPRFFKVYKSGSSIMGLEAAVAAADFPYILKPDREGNSRGLDQSSIVFDQNALENKVRELLRKYKTILVEKFLGNADNLHEYTVAMIGNGKNKLLMPAEIKLKQKKEVRIVTTQDKDNHLTQAIPVRDPLLFQKLVDFAKKAFESADMRDYSRCDLIMVDEKLYAIEINGLPMVPDKWFEVCASGVSLDSEQYIDAIIMAGMGRAIKNRKRDMQVPLQMAQILPAPIFTRLMDA